MTINPDSKLTKTVAELTTSTSSAVNAKDIDSLKDTLNVPQSEHVELFKESINGSSEINSVQNVEPASNTNYAQNTHVTPGEAILSGLKKLSNSHNSSKKNIAQQLEKISKNDGLNSADMIKLQQQASEYAILQELTAKVADKTSQGIQTLFRNQ